MSNYADTVNRTAVRTPQNVRARKEQVPNHAGGFVFKIDSWARLDRFVILGSEKNSYYVGSRTLTNENYESILECIGEDGLRAVTRIVELSTAGRAPKNAPAVFALAVCAAFGNSITKEAAFRSMPAVARTATDFFSFINQYKVLGGGFGVVARKGIEAWYTNKEISDVAYQIVKYRQRDGWTHLDALRLAHVRPRDTAEDNLFAFAKTLAGKTAEVNVKALPEVAQGYLRAQEATKASEIVELINIFNLPREAIPTQFLNEAEVWDSLLQRMPATALIRNLGKMTSLGVIAANNSGAKLVEGKLNDSEWLRKSRLHPITILNALSVYQSGHGVRGSLSWSPSRRVVDGLDTAFYGAFKNIVPTNKKFLLAIDISASMTWNPVSGGFSLTPRDVSAAMAMATAHVEDDYLITVFSTSLKEVSISPCQRLDDVVNTINNLHAGGTNCSLPMIWAKENNVKVDTFVVYTDNETWQGNIHPFEALKEYRKAVNPNAKLIFAATVASHATIADPSDAGMLDIVGFDASVPELISDFARD